MDFKDIGCEYKPISGYQDYFITIEGDVYSQKLRGNETVHRLRKLSPKNPGRANKYLGVSLCNDDGVASKQIHRLVAEHFVPGYFEGAVVNHKDGDNRNNKSDNLEWVTQEENIHKSYESSGINQTRNYLWWELFDPDGTSLGVFKGHVAMEEYVIRNKLSASPSSLTKYGTHNGYYIEKHKKHELH